MMPRRNLLLGTCATALTAATDRVEGRPLAPGVSTVRIIGRDCIGLRITRWQLVETGTLAYVDHEDFETVESVLVDGVERVIHGPLYGVYAVSTHPKFNRLIVDAGPNRDI